MSALHIVALIALLAVAATAAEASLSAAFGNGVASASAAEGCPFKHVSASSVHGHGSHDIFSPLSQFTVKQFGLVPAGGVLANQTDFDAVAADITALLTNSQSFWPADFGNYGPFFIRQAWHCAGSYRISDGLGGCDGGRQRFNPELSWADNTNLDKSKTLLAPIKEKYGNLLSWGDLIILAGNTAIASMGGPVLGFCAGRIDDFNGDASVLLGPTAEQAALDPCPINGNCTSPLGPTTVGLIYVNPEGPMGVPIPAGSAPQIRDTFARMGMNDNETVALIGGGHAFGKAHGACPLGAGPSPLEQPLNPWPGNCGSGNGLNTSTSGFEGSWTVSPTFWSNDFFHNLLNFQWINHTGPGGHQQWKPTDPNAPNIFMLTSDISLIVDPIYLSIVQYYASNLTAFNDAFSHAWYKLTSRDMGPVSRCLGKHVPPAQPFQNPLPPALSPTQLADVNAVKNAIRLAMNSSSAALTADTVNGLPTYRGYFVDLAFQCAATFRSTDYLGGCNGARVLLPPQNVWPMNAGLSSVKSVLQSVMNQFPSGLSWADLIVLAGNTALEDASGGQISLPFCGGRTDALAGDQGSIFLTPWDDGNFQMTVAQIDQFANFLNMSAQELVLLSARIRSPNRLITNFGFSGSYPSALTLSTDYFTQLIGHLWKPATSAQGKTQYTNADEANVYLTVNDIQLKQEPNYRPYVEYYAAAPSAQFYQDFAAAWTKLMNADRFAGPGLNSCATSAVVTPTIPPTNPSTQSHAPSTTNPGSSAAYTKANLQPVLLAAVTFAAVAVGSLYAMLM